MTLPSAPSALSMPMTSAVPSATTMKMRFPFLLNVDDESIEFALEEAVVICGTTAAQSNSDWIDNFNLTLAIQYYAAHLIQVSLMRMQSGTGLIKTSESTPELSVSYSAPPWPDPSKAIDLTQTIYGIRFLSLVRRNFPPVLVVNSAISFK